MAKQVSVHAQSDGLRPQPDGTSLAMFNSIDDEGRIRRSFALTIRGGVAYGPDGVQLDGKNDSTGLLTAIATAAQNYADVTAKAAGTDVLNAYL